MSARQPTAFRERIASVSVITPTHSRPRLLPRVVERERAAGAEVEVIVVDVASTDETAEACRKLNQNKIY